MKVFQWLILVFAVGGLLSGCASPSRTQSKAQSPASQEIVRGEKRSRAKAHTDLGFEYYSQRQFGIALQEAKVALQDDSSYTPTYNLLALVNMELNDEKSAEDAFQRALQLSPGDPEIANNYGWFLCKTKREQQSFQYFNLSLQNPLYPTPSRALNNAADCSIQIRDYKSAEGYLNRALILVSSDVRALLAMANVKYQQKQYVDARGYLAEAHRNSEPSSVSAWLALRIARQTGNRDDEARYLSVLRKKFPDSDEYKRLLQGNFE